MMLASLKLREEESPPPKERAPHGKDRGAQSETLIRKTSTHHDLRKVYRRARGMSFRLSKPVWDNFTEAGSKKLCMLACSWQHGRPTRCCATYPGLCGMESAPPARKEGD